MEAFGEALEEARKASGGARLAACRRAVHLYHGELTEGTGYEWAESYAETARHRALDAWTTIAEILQPADPDQALSARRRPFPTPTTSTCTCGSCGCRPQRATPRPSAAPWPCWNRNSPNSASRPAPRPGTPPPDGSKRHHCCRIDLVVSDDQ